MKNNKVVLLSLTALTLMAVVALPLTQLASPIRILGETADNIYTFDKNHQLDSDSSHYTLGEDEMTYSENRILSGGKYIHITGSGYGTSYENSYVLNSETNFLEATGGSSGSQTIFYFNFEGITSISWSMTFDNAPYYVASFILDIRDGGGNPLVSSTTVSDNSLTVDSGKGKSANARLCISNYLNLAISSLTFSYNCVGV